MTAIATTAPRSAKELAAFLGDAAAAPLALPLEADDAATINWWSDRRAATIIRRTPTTITVREDDAELLNGPQSGEPDALTFSAGGFVGHTSGVQRWWHRADPDGAVRVFSLRKSGRWVEKGQNDGHGSTTLTVGVRAHHYDYNF